MFVGDGYSDLLVKPNVARFIGFGGVIFRNLVCEASPYYIRVCSLASLLALGLTKQEYDLLQQEHQVLYQKGLSHISQGLIDMT